MFINHLIGLAMGVQTKFCNTPDIKHLSEGEQGKATWGYTKITEWTGGLYISPGFAGSRSGALTATAWTSMGEQGFMHITQQLMQTAQQVAEGVKHIDGLEVVGKPDMCLVVIKSTSKKLSIYKANDLMSQRGWHLNALQFASSVHMCFTAQHTEVVPELLKDLRDSVRALKEDPSCVKDGKAPAANCTEFGLHSHTDGL
ncbi:hypothetical protein WJX79_010044 [Trebouxia sp. C0005]